MAENLSRVTSAEVWRRRQLVLHQLGKLDMDVNRRRRQDRHLVRAEELVWEKPSASQPWSGGEGEGASYCAVISPDRGFNIHNFRIFMAETLPHTERGRYHTHGEAVKYYLSGRAIEYVGENEYQVKAGDFVFIPANAWHGTQNPYAEPVRVMAIQQMPGSYLQVPAPYTYREEDLVVPTQAGHQRRGSAGDPSKLNPAEVWKRRQVLLHELGKLDMEIVHRRQQDRHLLRAEELVFERSSASQPNRPPEGEGETYCRVVSPDVGFNIYNFRIFITQAGPGSQRGRYHTHGEAVKYYLSGRAMEFVGEKEYHVKAGDFVFIPANTWHGTQNPYDEPVKVMAIQQMPGTCLQVPAPYIYREEDLSI